jgi:hypothetical protein
MPERLLLSKPLKSTIAQGRRSDQYALDRYALAAACVRPDAFGCGSVPAASVILGRGYLGST